MRFTKVIFLALAFLALPILCQAQVLRFELGQRTKALDLAWQKQPGEEARQRASKLIGKAVTQFFAFKLNDAAKNIDEARYALFSESGRPPEKAWADSLYVTPAFRIIGSPEFEFTLNALYETSVPMPAGAEIRLEIGNQKRSYPVSALPLKDRFSFKLPPGDYELKTTVMVRGRALAMSSQTVSYLANASTRIQKMKYVFDMPGQASETDRRTYSSIGSILGSLSEGKTLETNYPAAALIKEADELTTSLQTGRAYLGLKRRGRQWVTFALPTGTLKTRLSIPSTAVEGAPLLLAIHGAGGSENMMFDGYGAGRIVSMAEARGWVVVSPQATGTKPESIVELIDAVDKLYHIDRSRVFIAGHSMGAMLTLASIQKSPSSFAAAAAVSGGISLAGLSDELKRLPLYVSAGSEDFALPGVRKLHEALIAGGIKQLEYREFPGIEHLMAFEVSLDGMFRVFDQVAKSHLKKSR